MLTDSSILTIGPHKDKPLKEVPASWLLWKFDVFGIDRNSDLGIYIKKNIESIRLRAEKETIKKQTKNE